MIEEQIDQLNDELRKVVHRFKLEYDLPVEAIIGVMEFIKADLIDAGVEFEVDFDLDDDSEETST
jgi:hypothetical protein